MMSYKAFLKNLANLSVQTCPFSQIHTPTHFVTSNSTIAALILHTNILHLQVWHTLCTYAHFIKPSVKQAKGSLRALVVVNYFAYACVQVYICFSKAYTWAIVCMVVFSWENMMTFLMRPPDNIAPTYGTCTCTCVMWWDNMIIVSTSTHTHTQKSIVNRSILVPTGLYVLVIYFYW